MIGNEWGVASPVWVGPPCYLRMVVTDPFARQLAPNKVEDPERRGGPKNTGTVTVGRDRHLPGSSSGRTHSLKE